MSNGTDSPVTQKQLLQTQLDLTEKIFELVAEVKQDVANLKTDVATFKTADDTKEKMADRRHSVNSEWIWSIGVLTSLVMSILGFVIH